jgi:hypothetical protein
VSPAAPSSSAPKVRDQVLARTAAQPGAAHGPGPGAHGPYRPGHGACSTPERWESVIAITPGRGMPDRSRAFDTVA